MKFSDLVERLGVPARQVRYMISEGLIPEANEIGRNADAWGEEHLSQGLRALDLQARGFPPAAVKILMRGGLAIPLATIGPVILSIDPSADPSDIDVEAALAEISSVLRGYVASSQKSEPATEE